MPLKRFSTVNRCNFYNRIFTHNNKDFDLVRSSLVQMANDPGTGIAEMKSFLENLTATATVIANENYNEWQALLQ